MERSQTDFRDCLKWAEVTGQDAWACSSGGLQVRGH